MSTLASSDWGADECVIANTAISTSANTNDNKGITNNKNSMKHIFLTILIVLGAVSAWGQGNVPDDAVASLSINGGEPTFYNLSSYENNVVKAFCEAVEDAKDAKDGEGRALPTTITLLMDVSGITESVRISFTSVTLDLNGHSISGNVNYENNSEYSYLLFVNQSTLTITDSSSSGSGSISNSYENGTCIESNIVSHVTVSGGSISGGRNGMLIYGEGKLSGGTVRGGMFGIITYDDFTVSGGTVQGDGDKGILNYNKLTVTGGTIKGKQACIENYNDCNLTISGGTLIPIIDDKVKTSGILNKGTLNLAGMPTFDISLSFDIYTNRSINITDKISIGSNFTPLKVCVEERLPYVFTSGYRDHVTYATGHTNAGKTPAPADVFNVKYPKNNDVYEGDAIFLFGETVAEVKENTNVAYVNVNGRNLTEGYDAFTAAVLKANEAYADGSSTPATLSLAKDITGITENINLGSDAGVTLDLNGKSISGNVEESGGLICVSDGKTLTITDYSEGGLITNGLFANAIENYGTLTISGGKLSTNGSIYSAGKLYISALPQLVNGEEGDNGHIYLEPGTLINFNNDISAVPDDYPKIKVFVNNELPCVFTSGYANHVKDNSGVIDPALVFTFLNPTPSEPVTTTRIGGEAYFWKGTMAIILANNASNSTTLNEMDGKIADVLLSDRILYKDGDWNTICLPFNVTLSGSPLAGAEARTLSSSAFDSSTGALTLNFSDPVETLAAGTPYIIKWNETDDADLTISTATEWNTFAAAVNSGTDDYSGKTVALGADIEVSTMVGTSDNRFKGTFDGRGHTLTFNATASGWYCAPFSRVEDAAIMNLHTTGTISTSTQYSAGLVGHTQGTTTISNCSSSVAISSTVEGEGAHGGFVAITYDSNTSTTTLTNCLFDGSITGANTKSCGGMIGDNGSTSTATLSNCVFRPKSITLATGSNATFARGNNVTVTKCYYSQNLPDATGQGTAIGSTSNKNLLSALGSGWKLNGRQLVPVMTKVFSNIVSPVFNGVKIANATTPTDITPTDSPVTFKGTYNSKGFDTDDISILFLGAENKLYWPKNGASIGACRAYFSLSDEIINSAPEGKGIRAFVMNFGDDVNPGQTTGIVEANSSRFTHHSSLSDWYSLDGRKLNGEPTQKGIYIHNGKKQIRK